MGSCTLGRELSNTAFFSHTNGEVIVSKQLLILFHEFPRVVCCFSHLASTFIYRCSIAAAPLFFARIFSALVPCRVHCAALTHALPLHCRVPWTHMGVLLGSRVHDTND